LFSLADTLALAGFKEISRVLQFDSPAEVMGFFHTAAVSWLGDKQFTRIIFAYEGDVCTVLLDNKSTDEKAAPGHSRKFVFGLNKTFREARLAINAASERAERAGAPIRIEGPASAKVLVDMHQAVLAKPERPDLEREALELEVEMDAFIKRKKAIAKREALAKASRDPKAKAAAKRRSRSKPKSGAGA